MYPPWLVGPTGTWTELRRSSYLLRRLALAAREGAHLLRRRLGAQPHLLAGGAYVGNGYVLKRNDIEVVLDAGASR